QHQVAVELQLAGHERGHAVQLALHQRDEVVVFHGQGDVRAAGGALGDGGGPTLDGDVVRLGSVELDRGVGAGGGIGVECGGQLVQQVGYAHRLILQKGI